MVEAQPDTAAAAHVSHASVMVRRNSGVRGALYREFDIINN